MNHLKVIFVLAIILAVMFFIFGIVLIVTFALNMASLETELAQAANFDRWNILIIVTGIFSLLFCGLNIYEVITFMSLKSGRKNSVVAEMIYILGLENEKRPAADGIEATPSVVSVDSARSIFGIGHDDFQRWTFAGRKPQPLAEPLQR